MRLVLSWRIQIRPARLRYRWNTIDAIRSTLMELDILLKLVLSNKASDLHLDVGLAPILRVNGALLPQ
jgi:hypothetical protein